MTAHVEAPLCRFSGTQNGFPLVLQHQSCVPASLLYSAGFIWHANDRPLTVSEVAQYSLFCGEMCVL